MNDAPSVTDTRYDRGFEVLGAVGGDSAEAVIARICETAPALARLTVEFSYGDIYTRPGLTLRHRQLINVAALSAMDTAAPQPRFHIDGALNVGVTPAEVVEAIIHISVYAGFPAALNRLAIAEASLADRPESASPIVLAPRADDEVAAQRYGGPATSVRNPTAGYGRPAPDGQCGTTDFRSTRWHGRPRSLGPGSTTSPISMPRSNASVLDRTQRRQGRPSLTGSAHPTLRCGRDSRL